MDQKNEGEEVNDTTHVEPVVRGERRAPGKYCEDRYRLTTPTFSGEEPLEQFASEFQDVMEIAQWPPRVALVKLRRALTEQAKPFGQRRNVPEVLSALRSRFGVPALEARARLQRLLQDESTPLSDHAMVVKRLAWSAYGDLPETHQRNYTLDDFIQTLNDPELQHQLRAQGVTTIDDALRVGEEYLEIKKSYTEGPHAGSVVTKDPPTVRKKLDQLNTLLRQAMETFPLAGTKLPTAVCWQCGGSGRLRTECSSPPKKIANIRKPRKPPRPREPGKEAPRGPYQRPSKRAPWDGLRE